MSTVESPDPRAKGPVAYPSEDDVAETLLHLEIRTLLRLLVQVWLAERGERALVLSDQFVYWVEGDNQTNLAPDLLVVPGEDPTRAVRSWKVWEEDHDPRFALEVVSEEIDKDYVAGPPKYDELGVEELVIYDPLVPRKGRTRRVRWQVYRRRHGVWSKVVETNDDRVESAVLGCWLVQTTMDGQPRIRLADGDRLVPTPEEAARSAASAANRTAHAARLRAEELEAEVVRLQALLAEANRKPS